jgi:hypothetical protein
LRLANARSDGIRQVATLLLVDDDDMAGELARIHLIDGMHPQCKILVALFALSL